VVPPCSDRIARVPPYSRIIHRVTRTGLSPTKARRSKRFRLSLDYHWPGPRSLATTSGVSVDVLSSRYLDVSVPWVCLKPPMYSEVSYLLLITGNPKPLRSKSKGLESSRIWSNPTPRSFDRGLGVPAIEGGFPHSEIHGSKLLRSSPWLIAA
jgi:hypothetical protein